ncbi:unnamed protein product, partial [Mesorhabditis spiculigera]
MKFFVFFMLIAAVFAASACGPAVAGSCPPGCKLSGKTCVQSLGTIVGPSLGGLCPPGTTLSGRNCYLQA